MRLAQLTSMCVLAFAVLATSTTAFAAEKNPQVLLKTSKGDVLLELYEDEAPNAVANFVNLVEKKFYDGLIIHRVIADFMAQGGCPDGRGTGGPGYKIACECYSPKARKHERGVIAMAHAGRNTGGSQFYITYIRTPHLDGKHTVFGRVVKGMDVVDSFNVSRTGKPAEKIISATVVSKRDHDYVPKKIQ
jgi:cyclophilin family peptidyl-prolyl cis-trans isomerase